jgi:hypothetical protein
MFSRNRLKNPGSLLSIGMVFFVMALMLPRFFPPSARFSPDSLDGVRGMLFGMSFGMCLWSARLSTRQRRIRGN